MTKFATHLWFDREARDDAEFYTSVFDGWDGKKSAIKSTTTLHDTPSGSVELVSIELAGQPFSLISADPLFRFNPSLSFLVACRSKKEVDALWDKLSKSGTPRVPLGSYPFSERYGWIKDRFGLSWQIIPGMMEAVFRDKNRKKLAQVTQAFLKMKKFDIEALRRAYVA